MKDGVTKKERDRAYHAAARALLEERRMLAMSDEEFDRRHREVVKTCYGEEEKAPIGGQASSEPTT